MRFHVPDPHPASNCGPLNMGPLPAGSPCPTCGTTIPGVSPLDERRQRAREAGRDASLDESLNVDPVAAVEAAIETATRVKLTDDVVDRYGGDRFDPTGTARRAVMREVLVACGFEVET